MKEEKLKKNYVDLGYKTFLNLLLIVFGI